MQFTVGNQRLLEVWRRKRSGGKAVPRCNPQDFIKTQSVGENLLLQVKAEDTSVHVAYCGGNIERLIGVDLTGIVVSKVFAGREHEELQDMQRAKFLRPMGIHSLSKARKSNGDDVIAEMLQLPVINSATERVVYVIGAFEHRHTDTTSNLGGGLHHRELLMRTVFDIRSLEPVDSLFTHPRPAGRPAQDLPEYDLVPLSPVSPHPAADDVDREVIEL